MTTRQELRPNHRIRARARRAITAPIVAALAVGLAVAANPVPAQAAAPSVAAEWTSLMYRSLTRQQTLATLKTTLAAQQTGVVTRTAEVTRATAASALAQTQLTTATAAATTARTRQTAAQTALATAKQNLALAQKKRPVSKAVNKAAVTKAQNAVTAATKTLALRQTQSRAAATTQATTQIDAVTAATAVTTVTTARDAVVAAVAVTQNRIATLPTAGAYADKAATMSKDVVNQTRTAFASTDTAVVYGTTVNKTVSYAFRRMVDDAKANGIAISGGGFRTRERQVELRKINGCPDVYTAPSSSCRVPTAIPGRSLHELGLAVDVTSGGKTLTRTSPAFQWLVLHAEAYGFVNLPSEPWHWSITGS